MARFNVFPRKKPATNSGIFSNSGAGQKKDPYKAPKGVSAARAELARHKMKKGS
jgi:hypothetical protein